MFNKTMCGTDILMFVEIPFKLPCVNFAKK